MRHGLIVIAVLLALSGCNREAKKDAGAGTAQGEVLPGSTSDAMLPLDTVKSQAPLAPKSEGGEGDDHKGTKPGKAGVKAAPASTDKLDEITDASPAAKETPAAN